MEGHASAGPHARKRVPPSLILIGG